MSIIYEPKGKAREYSPLSANFYSGCNHGCVYCYAPGIRRMSREQYMRVTARRNALQEFERDCKKNYGTDKTVLFCFMTDPYNELEKELEITRQALKIALKNKIPIQVLTKSKLVTRDIDVMRKFGNSISVGMSLTCSKEKTSRKWEPGAALPEERLKALKILKENGIPTWASFEPVYKPDESLEMLQRSLQIVDMYKIGKINNYKDIDKHIDWNDFLQKVIYLARKHNKKFYIKHDLRKEANIVKLYGNEVLMDEFLPEPFGKQYELFV
jgi:DNA repair photolyase